MRCPIAILTVGAGVGVGGPISLRRCSAGTPCMPVVCQQLALRFVHGSGASAWFRRSETSSVSRHTLFLLSCFSGKRRPGLGEGGWIRQLRVRQAVAPMAPRGALRSPPVRCLAWSSMAPLMLSMIAPTPSLNRDPADHDPVGGHLKALPTGFLPGLVACVLLYGILLGIVQNALIAIAIPTDVALYAPNNAAEVNGACQQCWRSWW